MAKAYVCNRWPSLQIGSSIQFRNGVCVAKSKDEEKLIQSNAAYGVQIHDRDLPEEAEEAAAVEAALREEVMATQAPEPRIRQGSRGTR